MLIPFGFLASAGGAAGSYELISTTLVSSNTALVTLDTSAMSGYKHLQIRMTTRSSVSATYDNLAMRFNGVTAALYHRHFLFGNGTSVLSNVGNSESSAQIMQDIPGATATSNIFATAIVDILDFGSTTKSKTSRNFGGQFTSSTQRSVSLYSNLFVLAGAITSVSLFAEAGSLVAGSRFSIYGIKA